MARFPVRHTCSVRVTLIVNPFASAVTQRARVLIQQRLAADNDLTVIETTKGGHAIRLAHGAGRAGAEVVIALGGDGTINEVANGLLGTDTAVAPLPGGSTNVFARAIGYPNDPVAATSVLVEAMAAGSIRPVGVGLANGRAFLFHCGAGFDAAVVERVEQRGPLKRYVGHPLFLLSTLTTWYRRVDRAHPWFAVESDDGRQIGSAHLAIALNCNPYTYLGNRPLDLAPEAGLGSPLSVVTLRSLGLRALLPAAVKAVRSPDGVPDGGFTGHWSGVSGAVITGYREFPYQLDGEFLAPTSELRLDHRPDAIRLVLPVGGR